MRELLVFGFFALVHWRSLGVIGWVSRLLGSRPFYWLGELSYGTYLIHLLILQPVAAAVIGQFGIGLGAAGRFALTGAIVVPVTYALAFVTYKLVEPARTAAGQGDDQARSRGQHAARASDRARKDRGALAIGYGNGSTNASDFDGRARAAGSACTAKDAGSGSEKAGRPTLAIDPDGPGRWRIRSWELAGKCVAPADRARDADRCGISKSAGRSMRRTGRTPWPGSAP